MKKLVLAFCLICSGAFAADAPKLPSRQAPPVAHESPPDSAVLTLTFGDLKALLAAQSAQAQAQIISQQASEAQKKLQAELRDAAEKTK